MPLDITIPSAATTSPSGSKPYTAYTLAIKGALRTSTTQKRYTDFENLHQALISATGAAPPAPLPSKSWFARTVNSPGLTEERRQGLERYMREIENADDARWRNSRVWREFLGVGATPSSSNNGDGVKSCEGFGSLRGKPGAGLGIGGQISTAAGWLEGHAQLKAQLHEARTALNRREHAAEPGRQHEAGAGAKKSLVRAGTLIAQLDDGLRRLGGPGGLGGGPAGKSSGSGDGDMVWAEKLGEGEIRRRRDMLSSARKEKEALEGVLNTLAVKSTPAGAAEKSLQAQQQQQAHEGAKGSLLGGGRAGARTTGRVLGAPKETERTRELDNEGVLQLQKQIMQEQDLDVDELAKVVRRMREMGIQINEELEEQSTMLDLVDQDADRVQNKVDVAKKRIAKIR